MLLGDDKKSGFRPMNDKDTGEKSTFVGAKTSRPNFGAGLESCLRINFATSTALVDEIVRRMEVALGRD